MIRHIAFCLGILLANSMLAIDEFEDVKTISRIQFGTREVESAYRLARSEGCELIPGGEALEVRSFAKFLTNRDRRIANKSTVLPAARRSLFSVGLNFESGDRAELPSLSRSSILEYVQQHCLIVQGRVRRDLLDRQLYYHHRPLAVTAKYRGTRVTQDFEPIVSANTRQFRSLGMFIPEGKRLLKATDYRTIVLLFRSEMLIGERRREQYEYVFVRGKERLAGADLEPHVFITTDGRTQLHYLRSNPNPASQRQTAILGNISITDFDRSGIYPKESATRSFRLDERQNFSIQALDEHAASIGLEAGFGANVTEVLDSILSGDL